MSGQAKEGLMAPGVHYLQGAQACIEGALLAGLGFYAGYPITPASEMMEWAARRLPQTGGRFIQMEDEIGSAAALIGASWAGAKAMTATSGPGFSLMQEAISFGIMSETPLVIVDVQRPGPGQGYINSSQEDVMQARWGHHGEGAIIALCPASVQELFELTIEAFNLAERWRSPVLIMTEEVIAHMRERLVVPPRSEILAKDRKKPQDLGLGPEEYLPWGHGQVAPMAAWGEGYRVNLVGLVHHEDGNVTHYSDQVHQESITRLRNKIEGNVDRIARLESRRVNDCDHLVVCYGSVSRTALEAVEELRQKTGLRLGLIRLITLWPFAGEALRRLVRGVDRVFVPEMNLGMMVHPVREALRDRCREVVPIGHLGRLHTPELIMDRILGELG